MARIYQTASQVVVYLGEGTPETDAAMRLLRDIHDGQEDNSEQPKSLIQALFQRPWFSRVWVLQEISLAKQAVFVCGGKEVEWDVFKSFYHWNNNSKWIETLPYAIEYPATRDREWFACYVSYGEMLQRMLRATRHCGATDPRDKLYAILPMLDFEYEELLLGLGQDSYVPRSLPSCFGPESDQGSELESDQDSPGSKSDQDPAEPDSPPPLDQVKIPASYHHSVQQVYTNLAVTLLESIGLGILSMNIGSPRPMDGLSSWVPDWSSTSAYCWPGNNPPRWTCSFSAGFAEEPKRLWGRDDCQPGPSDAWRVSGLDSSSGEPRPKLHLETIPVGAIQRIADVCDIRNNLFPMAQWISVAPDPKFHDKSSGAKEARDRRALTDDEESNLRSLCPFLRTLAVDDVVYPEAILAAAYAIEEYDKGLYDENGGGGSGDDDDAGSDDGELWGGAKPAEGRWGKYWPMFRRRGRKHGSSEKMPLCDIFNGEGSYGVQARRLFEACNGRRLLVTDTGYIGLATATAAVGDSVHVVQGARLPYVFRPAASGENLQLVGEAYVHGIMYGEIWDDGNGTVPTEIVVE